MSKFMFLSKDRVIFNSLAFGGLSIIFILVFQILDLSKVTSNYFTPNSMLILTLLGLTSYPHFMASYFYFYKNETLVKDHKMIGIVLPLLLSVLLFLPLFNLVENFQNILLTSAWILLYWHFAKQSYGCSVYLGNSHLKLNSKKILSICYLLLAGIGFALQQKSAAQVMVFKSYVATVNLPSFVLLSFIILFGVFYLAFSWNFFRSNFINLSRSKHEKSYLLAQFKTFFILQIPLVATGFWFIVAPLSSILILVPVFHALQYAPFILQVLKNQNLKQSDSFRDVNDSIKFKRNLLYIVSLSTLFFILIPFFSLKFFPEQAEFITTSIFIFLNVHHFFIDSVSWKLSSPLHKNLSNS